MEKVQNGVHDTVHDGVQDVSMMTYDDVLDWLNQVKMLDELIDAKISERDQWLELGTKITPIMSGMPHAPGVSDKVGNAAVKLADMAEEINILIDQLISHKQWVCSVLERLPAEEYGVLHRHFIQYKTLGQIADEMDYCYMQIWRFKESGIGHLQTMLGGE